MTAEWPSGHQLAAMRAAAAQRGVTNGMAEAAHNVLSDYFDVSWSARARDFLRDDMSDEERSAAVASVRAEDARLWEATITVMAAAVAAAIAAAD